MLDNGLKKRGEEIRRVITLSLRRDQWQGILLIQVAMLDNKLKKRGEKIMRAITLYLLQEISSHLLRGA